MSEIVAWNLGVALAGEGLSVVKFLDRSAAKVRADISASERLAFASLGRERFAYWVRQGAADAETVAGG